MDSSRSLNTKSVAEKMMLALTLMLMVISVTVSFPAGAVLIDGRDWQQPYATTNFSYDHAAAVCDLTTGECSGEVVNQGQPSVDLTGMIWASQEEVASLFLFLLNEPGAAFDPQNGYVGENGPQWVIDAIDFDGDGPDTGLFSATSVGDNIIVGGITRTTVIDRQGNLKASREFIRYEPAFNQGRAVIGNPIDFDAFRQHTGLWLYRAVPEPSSAYLLLVGLLLALRARKTSW